MRWGGIGKPLLRLFVCFAAVLAATAALYRVPIGDRALTAVFTYLFVVIASGIWGFRYTVFVSFLTSLGFSWLLPPVGRFWLSDARDVFALAAFLVIGITTSHLSDRARKEALKANQRRAEAVAAHQRFRDLVNSVEGIVWEADAETFAFSFVSEQAERILGYPVEQWLREPTFWKDHLHPEDRASVMQFCEQIRPQKRAHDFEYRMISADGRVVWLRNLVTVVVEDELATQLSGVMIDITKRKQDEKTLREREARIRRLIDADIIGVFLWDIEGPIFEANDTFLRMVGYDREDLVSGRLRWTDLTPPEWRDRDAQLMPELNMTGRIQPFEKEYFRKDGSRVPVLIGIADFEQSTSQGVAFVLDLSERKHAEQARQQLEEQWRAAFESNPTMYFIIDAAGAIVSVNAFGAEQLGYTVGELLGQSVLDVFYEPDRDSVQNHAKECFEQPGRTMRWEARKIRKDGSMLWVRETANAVVLQKRPVLLVVCENITEQKRAEDAARRSEKELREIVETMPAMAWSALPDGSNAFVTRQWTQYTGLTAEQMSGSGWQSTVHPEDLGRHMEKWRRSLATGEALENEVRFRGAADGQYRWFLARSVPVRDEQGNISKWYGIATDIEDRKRAEEALRRSERELRDLIETTPSLTFSTWPDGAGEFTTGRWREYSGLSTEETFGERGASTIYPDDRDIHLGKWRASLASGEPFENEARHRSANGEYRWFLVRAVPLCDEHGGVLKWYGSLTDIEDRKRAEQALQRSEAYLAEAQRLSHTGSWAWEMKTLKVLYCSDEMYRIFGFDPQDGVPTAEDFEQRMYPEDHDNVHAIAWKAIGQKADYVVEHRIVRPDGILKYIRTTGHPVLNGTGEVVEYFGTSADVTEHKRAEEALRRSEAYLTEAQRLTKTGSWAYNPFTGKTVYWSAEMFRILGLDPQSGPSSEQFWQLVHPDDIDRVRARVAREAHEKTGYDDEYRIVLSDGTVKHILDIGRPVFNDAGDVTEFVGTTVDVTERKRAEDALRRSEAYLAEAQRLTQTGSWAWDPRSDRMIYCSEELYRIFDVDPQAGVPSIEVLLERVHPEDRDRVRAESIGGSRNKTKHTIEYRLLLPNGTIKYVISMRYPGFDETGEFVEIIGTIVDVTERKRAEELLRESEGRFRTIFENAGAGVALVDGQGRPIKCNPTFTKMLGFTEEELRSMVFTEFTHPDDIEADWRLYREVVEGKRDRYDIEKRYIKKDGQVMWGQLIVSRVKNKDGASTDYMVAMIEDITERKRAQQALQRSESYLAEAQRLTHTGSWAYNPEAEKSIYWSEETFRIFGRSSLPDLQQFLRMVHPEDRESFYERLVKAFGEKAEIVQDYRTVLPDGTVKHIHQIAHPVLDEAGDLIEYVGTDVDVTDLKRAEEERERLRQLEAELARMNRVTTMGELTASLAHEINQPIAATVTNASTSLRWLAHDPPNIEEAREAAKRSVKDANRAAEIIGRVRQLFRKGATDRDLVDVNELIREMIVLLLNEARRYSISVRPNLDPNLPSVMADRVQLQQVLMNLMLNGIDAVKDMDGERELTIKSGRQNHHLLISVTDTGMGLPPQAEKIFDAFFTTKAEGTGMGLSISRSIIESHGGRLWAMNNPPHGATFHFTLPKNVEAHDEDTRGRSYRVHH